MGETKQIRVVVADDHPVVCKGLCAIIQAEPGMQVVAEAYDGQQAVQAYRQYLPDVTLIDLRMPVMGGVQAIKTIRQEFPQAAIIILTTFKGDEDIFRGLGAGARGYLLKGMPNYELLTAIRRIHEGGHYIPKPVLDMLAKRPTNSDLNARELQVLNLIVKGMSNKQIGEELGISESTVKWYVNILLARLNVADRTGAAVTALRRGIVEL